MIDYEWDTIQLINSDTNFDFKLPILAEEFSLDNRFIIKSLEGLGSPKFTLALASSIGEEFDNYMDSIAQPREMVLTIGLNPTTGIGLSDLTDITGNNVRALRKFVYEFATAGYDNKLNVKFLRDYYTLKYQISGYVKKISANHFSRTPEIQMTIYCPDPYFYTGQGRITQTYTSISNSTNYITLNYQGTTAVGFKFKTTFGNAVSSPNYFALHEVTPANSGFKIDTFSFEAGDIFEYSSEEGNRYAKVTRSGGTPLPNGETTYDLTKYLKPAYTTSPSPWPDANVKSSQWTRIHPLLFGAYVGGSYTTISDQFRIYPYSNTWQNVEFSYIERYMGL